MTVVTAERERNRMQKAPLGELQLEILRFLSAHGPLSVGEVTARFGEPRGLARTTVLTVMERLREKGFLTRTRHAGLFEYAPSVPKAELLRHLVQDFVEKTLGGSLSPLAVYLASAQNITEEELAELKQA